MTSYVDTNLKKQIIEAFRSKTLAVAVSESAVSVPGHGFSKA